MAHTRKCVRFGKSKGKRVCRKYSGGKTAKKSGKAKKGRCVKYSKGRTRCLKRAK